MARVELTRGQWAEVRDDVDDITHRERRSVLYAYDDVEGPLYEDAENQRDKRPAGDMRKGTAVTDALIRLLVTKWSLELPLPSESPDVIEELRAKDYDLLAKAVSAVQKQMFADFDPDPNEGSPTEPLGNSEDSSRASSVPTT